MVPFSRGADRRSFGVRFHGGTAQPGVPFVPSLPPSPGHGHSLVGTIPSLKSFLGNGCRAEGLCQQPGLSPCHLLQKMWKLHIRGNGEHGQALVPTKA